MLAALFVAVPIAIVVNENYAPELVEYALEHHELAFVHCISIHLHRKPRDGKIRTTTLQIICAHHTSLRQLLLFGDVQDDIQRLDALTQLRHLRVRNNRCHKFTPTSEQLIQQLEVLEIHTYPAQWALHPDTKGHPLIILLLRMKDVQNL